MNLINTKSFSFTFTIPPFKKVYWKSKRRKYGSLSNNQQYFFLEDIMIKIINPLNFYYIDWIYEKHEDGRLHIHGFVILDDEKENEIYKLRDTFYSYNERINIKICSYLKLSDIQETRVDINYWLEYINKHQNEIIYKNGYRQMNEDINNLEYGIVKIKGRYKRPEGYYDTYRFGRLDDTYISDNSLSVEM